MQYGYFDDSKKEYVITRPDTPRPWSNYLGSTTYGAIITNNAGGYSFYHSAAQGRFMRIKFNNVPLDQPGRYIYLHDQDTKDYWSASWQPTNKPLEQYKSTCQHGTAYTIITSEYAQIKSEITYFVPLGKEYECWAVKLTNLDSKPRKLSAFAFVEYSNNWSALDDQNNLQYSQYIVAMKVKDNMIDHGTNVNIPFKVGNLKEKDQGRHTFMALVGSPVIGYDTDLLSFLGDCYHTYRNPVVIEKGQCTNSVAVADNACGVLQTRIELKPGETKTFQVLIGIGSAEDQGTEAIQEINTNEQVLTELNKVIAYWHFRLQGMEIITPDKELNSQLNMWSPYNCLMTYSWSRAASLVYAGERDGLGYRDTVQDILGVLHMIPEEARERLELMITGQISLGGAMPVVKPFAHYPGKEVPPKPDEYRSDDCLWLFNTIPAYVKETGDINFYEKVLPYADKGEASIIGHMKQALIFNLERHGMHQLPSGLHNDWNDCIRTGPKGESIFVAFQVRYGLKIYMDICSMLNKTVEVAWAKDKLTDLDNRLEKYAWDGEWFMRAYSEEGEKIGSKESLEGKIYLNPQVWAVISGHATNSQAEKIMKKLKDELATPYGIMLCAPPYQKTKWNVMGPNIILATLFNPGMKENSGIFCHTQGWAVIAESMLGHGNQAYEYFRSFMPATYNTKAEIRQIEPYVYCQSTHSKYSPRFGSSRLPWLTGAATWAYYSATQYILGIQPDYQGMKIDPCIPEHWNQLQVTRRFRKKILKITIQNPNKVQKGVKQILLNGQKLSGNLIKYQDMKDQNEITVLMG